jgi:hypothetical protein
MKWDGVYELLRPGVKVKPLHRNTVENNLANLISTPKMSGTAQDCKGSVILTNLALIFLSAPAVQHAPASNMLTMQLPLRSIDAIKTEEHSSYGGYIDVALRCKDGSRFDFRCPSYPSKPDGYLRTPQDQPEAVKEKDVLAMEEEIKWLVAEANFTHDRRKPMTPGAHAVGAPRSPERAAEVSAGSHPVIHPPSTSPSAPVRFPDFTALGAPALDLHEELVTRQGACDKAGPHSRWRVTKVVF